MYGTLLLGSLVHTLNTHISVVAFLISTIESLSLALSLSLSLSRSLSPFLSLSFLLSFSQ